MVSDELTGARRRGPASEIRLRLPRRRGDPWDLASISQGLHEVILPLPLHPILNGLEICDPTFDLLALRAGWGPTHRLEPCRPRGFSGRLLHQLCRRDRPQDFGFKRRSREPASLGSTLLVQIAMSLDMLPTPEQSQPGESQIRPVDNCFSYDESS